MAFKLESLPHIIQEAKSVVLEERKKFTKLLELVYTYIKKHKLIIKDIQGELVSIATTKAFYHCNELVNALCSINELVELRTIHLHKEFMILVERRPIVNAFTLEKHNDVSIESLLVCENRTLSFPSYVFNNTLRSQDFLISPSEYMLIALYKKVYNLFDNTEEIKEQIISAEKSVEKRKKILTGGGADNQAAKELLKYIKDTNKILIGERATQHDKVFRDTGRIQWICAEQTDKEDIKKELVNYMAKHNITIVIKTHKLYITFQNRFSVYSKTDNLEHIGDYFIERTLVPYYPHYYKIGHPYVIKRYLLIDLFTAKLIERIKKIRLTNSLNNLYNLYIQCTGEFIQDDMKEPPKWSGQFLEEDVKFKRDKRARHKQNIGAATYYPKKYEIEKNTLRVIPK